MINNRGTAATRVGVARAADHIGRVGGSQSIEQRTEPIPLGSLDAVVGVEPECVVAGGASQRRVASGGKVVDPDEIEHPGSE